MKKDNLLFLKESRLNNKLFYKLEKAIKKIFILIFFCLKSTIIVNAQTADSSADRQTKCILQYLSGLPSQTGNRVISGQWMNYRGLPETPFSEFDTVITALYNQTNEWVGIIGTNYARFHTIPYYIAIENMKQVNQPLINYSRQNGLIFIMANFKNPWNQTNSNDLSNSNNLLDVVTNGHPANTNFNKELDSLAIGFSQLQDSSVTVLFRPFHEMNGNWFWWGSKTSTLPVNSDFTALWNYVFNYLTNVKNIHNVLWCYTPSARESTVGNPAFKTELFYYPGDSLVDVIGLDIYNDTLDIPNYNSIIALNKPVGIAEFGQRKQTVQNNPFVYDYSILINQIRNKYPKLCYWVSWNHFKNRTNDWIFYSMTTQSNTTNLLTDPWVVNRNEIDYSDCLTTRVELPMSQNGSINISPNPSSDYIEISSPSHKWGMGGVPEIKIYNTLGECVINVEKGLKPESGEYAGQIHHIDISRLPSGLYFLKINDCFQKFEVFR